MRAFFREPLLHFIMLGLIIYSAGQLWPKDPNQYRIVIDSARVEGIRQNYVSEYGTQPSAGELTYLIDANIRDEILYREGIARQLDRDDEIVHRRVVQKAEFLLQDMTPPPSPSPVDIEAYYKNHIKDYELPGRTTFTHIYFSPDTSDAKARALAALQKLRLANRSRAPELGDTFSDQTDYTALDITAVDRVFGDSKFSAATFNAPIGQWTGPFQSELGWHLLRVTAREEPRTAPLDEIEDGVRADWQKAVAAKANAEAFARIKAKYDVVRDDVKDSEKPARAVLIPNIIGNSPTKNGQN
jgi:hypothetical protein